MVVAVVQGTLPLVVEAQLKVQGVVEAQKKVQGLLPLAWHCAKSHSADYQRRHRLVESLELHHETAYKA